MPVIKKRLGSKDHPAHDRLVSELMRHLNEEPGLPDFPKIFEEDVRLSDNIRVVVAWNDWSSVPETERAEIILEAYKGAKGIPAMLRISSAMGLTPLEAKQLGIELD